MRNDRATNLGHGITVGDVEDLLTAAGRAGDLDMCAICEDALEHDQVAIAHCAMVIAASRRDDNEQENEEADPI